MIQITVYTAIAFVAIVFVCAAVGQHLRKKSDPLPFDESNIVEYQARHGIRCATCKRFLGGNPASPRECRRCRIQRVQSKPLTDAMRRGLQCQRCEGALIPMAHPCDCPRCAAEVEQILKRFAELEHESLNDSSTHKRAR